MTGRWKTPDMTWVKFFLAFLTAISLIFFSVSAGAAFPPPKRVLILYEMETGFGEDFPLVGAFQEYLGHFNLQVEKLQRSQWKPGDLSSGYQVIFYLGNEKAELPLELLEEMDTAPELVWIEKNIDQYARLKKWQDFRDEGTRQFTSLFYKQMHLPVQDNIPVYCAFRPSARVFSTAEDMSDSVPYVWQSENLWYIGKVNFSEPFIYVFADLLHDICGENHPDGRQVLVRIEDVDPRTPPAKLAAVIDAVSELHVPYAVTVIPAAILRGRIITLTDAPELVEVLKRVENTGGCIVQHGYTHQNEYSPLTGEGFEFWNAKDDKPMPGDEEVFVNRQVNSGLAVLAGAGLYPVAFVPPHYAMSGKGYRELSKHFDILVGHVQLSDKSYKISLSTPYITRSPRTGMLLYPENLGYYDNSQEDSIEKILTEAEYLTVVRDCSTCFFFHYYLPPRELVKIIKGLKELGYQFIDLRYASYNVESDSVKIISKNGKREVVTDIPPNQAEITGTRLIFKKWLNSLTALLITVVISFLLIIWTIRRNKKRFYEVR
jgi:uncharacterized protein YdaL